MLLVIAAIAYGAWRISLRWYPYRPCRWCKGRKGNIWGSTKSRWGDCPFCDGKGKRLRFGARTR
jgi:hypothetical protein